MSTEPMASEATQQSEQQVDGGYGGQTAAFNEQAGGPGGPQQNEQQVGGGYGGQAAAFNEQAGGPGAPQQNEQQVGGHGGQTAAFNEQAGGFGGESRGEASRAPVFHGTTSQPESGAHGDVPAGVHGGEPVSYVPADGGESHYGTPAYEEPAHVSGEEHSFEDAGHVAGAGDAGGDGGHGGGAGAGPDVHHG